MKQRLRLACWLVVASSLLLSACSEDKGAYIPEAADVTPPGEINSLEAIASTDSTVILRWLAAGDDPRSGVATKYEIGYQSHRQLWPWWDHAERLPEIPSRVAYFGLVETTTVSGLTPMEWHYFRIRAADEVPNWSGLSNVAEVFVGLVDVSGPWWGRVWGLWDDGSRRQDIDLDFYHWGPVRSLGGTFRLLGQTGDLHYAEISGNEISLIIRFESWDRDFWFDGVLASPNEINGGCSMREISSGEVFNSGWWYVLRVE